MLKTDLISFREKVPTDEAFIYATWLKGYQGGAQWFRMIPRKIFQDHYRRIIEKLLQRSLTRVACLKEDTDVIIGYSVSEQDRVHWIYIKENWRKIGIAKDLLPANFSSVSHLTNLGFEILKKYPQIIYQPFL